MKIVLAVFLLACGAGRRPAAARDRSLPERISALIEASPDLSRAHIGYQFVNAETGQVLADNDSSRSYTPASNRKLFTTALALFRLGPGYKFKTELRTREAWKPGQTVLHDLEFAGGGDPNLSGRVLPYSVNAHDGDPLAAVEQLANRLVKLGIREIDGDVTGVATRYPGDRFPPDWTIEDAIYGYGAPVSALTIDDNTISATVTPSQPGGLAMIEFCPQVNHFIVLNQIVTDRSSATDIHARRAPGSNELILWGTIGQGAPAWQQDFAIEDPAQFAAEALVSVLRDRGIIVRGAARSLYSYADEAEPPQVAGTVLAAHESGPLWQDLQLTNKVSENLHAEMLLREVAFVQCGLGTLKSGLDAEKTFLQQIGMQANPPEISFFDGCGLARADLATPASIVALLRYMWQSPYRGLWLQTLPIGGVDGTLQHRFKGIADADRVHAKTGTLAHDHALSGYVETARNRWIAFSIVVNGTSGNGAAVTDFIDHVCAIFLGDRQKQ